MGWIVQFVLKPELREPDSLDAEAVLSRLWDLGTDGIGELATGHLVAGFVTEAGARTAAGFLESQAAIDIECLPVDTTSWHDPDKLSTVLVPTNGDGLSFSLKAGPSFGHGEHETTKLILDVLNETTVPGQAVLDVGTGSGVLAIAAKLLGADDVVAIDIDPEAVTIAAANAARNNVEVDVSSRSVEELANDVLAADHEGRFDLVVANVLLVAHSDIAASVVKLLAPGGRVVTSGYLPSQSNDVVTAYHPLPIVKAMTLGPWSGHILGTATAKANA